MSNTPTAVPAPAPKPAARAKKTNGAAAPSAPMTVSEGTLAKIRGMRRRSRSPMLLDAVVEPFRPAEPPPGSVPRNHKFAMDALTPTLDWANGYLPSWALMEGLAFVGYPILAEMAQRPEYRRISERLATEMTRKWIKLSAKSSDDKSKGDKIKELEASLEDLKLREAWTEIATQDGFFGRSHLYLDVDDAWDNPDELKKPIGDGSPGNRWTKAKIKKGSLKRISTVEPIWCYPARYNASNPLAPDWFKPEHWYCMARQVHHTRLLTFVGREVPDILKPAYAFGGLSLSQMGKAYVDNWLNTRDAVVELVRNFSRNGIETDMAQVLSPNGSDGEFLKRLQMYADTMDNMGLMVMNMGKEKFFQWNTPLGTLDQLQAQAQEQLCSFCGIPVVVLLGLTPHGLNASSDGEIRAFEDWIEAYQKHFAGDKMKRVLDIAMISLWGSVDEDIVYSWVPLHSLDESAIADVQAKRADVDTKLVGAGILDPIETRKRLANDEHSGYNDIDVEAVPEQDEGDDFSDLSPGNDNEDDEEVGKEAAGPFARDASWEEAKHPRDKGGEFSSGGGGSANVEINPTEMKKVGGQKGSNPGGVYEAPGGERYYVKQGRTPEHVENEAAAARLYALAGAPTLDYHPVAGGKHIATKMEKLDKANVKDLSPAERKTAQADFGVHAWLANWDAVGLGGDNVGTVNGTPTSLDLGGALAYRAQGGPKGAAFGTKVGELKTLRDPKMNPDSARLYGSMTSAEIKTSVARVTSIPDAKIREAAGDPALAEKLIARKNDMAKAVAGSETTSWSAKGSATPGSLNGTNERRMPLAERQALRARLQDHVVSAVSAKLPEGTGLKAKWLDRAGEKSLSIMIQHKDDPASFANGIFHLDNAGNLYVQQHDVSLNEKYRGTGLGGRMIAALAAGYRAVGAGKGDVPIHVNTNPSFWDHMRKKHNGIFGDAAMASDAEWEETKHPRGKGGKFAETAGGETGGGATPEAPKQPAFMKLHKGGATPEAAHKKTVEHVLNEKTKTGANYRGLIKHLINEAPKHGNGEAVNHLKAKLGHSYEVASEKLIDLASKSKDYDEQKQLIAMAEKAKKQAKKYGFETAPMPAIAPAPKAAAPAPAPPKPEPAPAPKPAAAKAPQASPADLEKAKKPTSFPTGSATSLEGKKIIEAFNAKYGGKTITDPEALNQKVADFKGMQAFVAQENVKAKEAAVQAQAQKEKKAKELAAKQAEEYAKQFSTPEAKAHYEVLAAIAGGGKSAKAYFEHAQTKIKNAGLEGKIDAPSAAMIIAYTGSSFREVNSQLRQGIMTPEQYKYTKALNGALDKLPPYVGTCYRKADVPKATAANFKPGFIVPERAFTSSSKNEDIWSGDYHYVIESKGGRDVQKLSSHGGEAEVLFKANTHFMVTKVDGNKIHMTEVD